MKRETDVVSKFVGPVPTFVGRVYDTRNYQTHYDKNLKSKAAKGDEQFFLMQYLTIAIQTSLLYELGFTPEHCVQIFEKSRLYQFLRQQQKYRR
ncbi:MAG TPA: HEPN domain-containing protein [Ktedonobacteraceae bacterium]